MYINNKQYKINILFLEDEKRKNKGHPRERVIQLIAIMERFLSKILELQYLIYMTFFKVQ